MAFEFKFPDVGEGITEGTLLKWLVKEGDTVKGDQPIAEVETDKAVVEVPSPRAGTVLRLPWKAGDTIKVGEVIAVIGEKGEKYEARPKPAQAKEKPVSGRDESVSVVGILKEKEIELPGVSEKGVSKPSGSAISALPKVRKLAQELGVNISSVKGTGESGMITEDDVRMAAGKGIPSMSVPAREAKISFEKYGRITVIPLTATRKAIAEHMQKSVRIAPHAVAMEEADVSELAKVREKEKEGAESQGIRLTFLPFIIKAVIAALKKHPFVNASLDEEKQAIVTKQYYNIGVAVDTTAGLMVPVIKNADAKSILGIAKEIEMLAQQCRDRKIALEDLRGGTFTITNYGSIAGTFGVPIINHPEAAILGLGRIKDAPKAVKEKTFFGSQKIEVRKVLPLSLSFDHRIVDGAEAARFLQDLIKHLEDPDLLLVDID